MHVRVSVSTYECMGVVAKQEGRRILAARDGWHSNMERTLAIQAHLLRPSLRDGGEGGKEGEGSRSKKPINTLINAMKTNVFLVVFFLPPTRNAMEWTGPLWREQEGHN